LLIAWLLVRRVPILTRMGATATKEIQAAVQMRVSVA
jgi:hypothetical protein